ncbi:MAG: hypothetical protein HC871_01150 [Rhizobiales bacterium]|nr:hypothetical protein [Hyphomicrobiales bacterium]
MRLKAVIEQLLERSLGSGRVHAEVSAEIDLDQVTMTEETFDPDGQVVRSTQTIEEETERAERNEEGAVTVGNNLPNAGVDNGGNGSSNSENTVRTEETVNYEISRTVRNHTQVGGEVKRLSVAVLVGGREILGADGVPLADATLDQQELDEIASLVRSAIGFNAERGDTVDVKNMPFAETSLEEIETSLFDLTKSDILRLVELGALLVLALFAIFLVVRPAMAKLMPEPVMLNAKAGDGDGTQSGGNLPAIIDERGKLVAKGGSTAGAGASSQTSGAGEKGERVEIGIPGLDDPVRVALIQQARDVIQARPDDAAALLKQWISQEPGSRNG